MICEFSSFKIALKRHQPLTNSNLNTEFELNWNFYFNSLCESFTDCSHWNSNLISSNLFILKKEVSTFNAFCLAVVTAYNKQKDFKPKYSLDKLYCIQGIYKLIVVQVAGSQKSKMAPV